MIEVVSGTRQSTDRSSSPTQLVAGLSAAALLAVIAIAALQFLLPAQLLGKAVSRQIENATGLSTRIDGAAEFRLFPRPRVIIRGIHLIDRAGAVSIDVPRAVGYVRFLPLVAGRAEIGQAVLFQPKFLIDLNRMQIGASEKNRPPAKANKSDAAPFRVPLGKFTIIDGNAVITTSGAPAKLALDAMNVHVNWPRLDGSAEFGGSLNFRKVPTRLEGWIEQPLEVLHGHDSASVFQLKSTALAFWSSGRISGWPKFQYHGSISASAPSLRVLAETAGYGFTKHGTFADLDLTCDVDYDASSAAFTNLNLKLDGNDYEGTLDIQDLARVPRISGTLASGFVDVTPFLTGMKEPAERDGLWSRKPLDLGNLDLPHLDLRVSAARLRLYDIEVGNAALSLLTKPGLLDLDLPEATSNSGTIKGHFELTEKAHQFNFRVSGSGNGINIQPMVFEHHRPLSGALDGSLALESSGENLDALIHGLTGQATLAARTGTFTNIALVSTLAHAAARKPGEEVAAVAGTTVFDQLNLNLDVMRGVATVKSGQVSGPDLQLRLAGTIDVGQRRLDVISFARVSQSPGDASRANPAQIELRGRWADLHFYKAPADVRLPSFPPQKDALPDTRLAPPLSQE